MKGVRAEIDRLDRRIVALLDRRLEAIAAAARIKTKASEIRDAARIADVLAKVRRAAGRGHGDFVVALYRHLVELSIEREAMLFRRHRRRRSRMASRAL